MDMDRFWEINTRVIKWIRENLPHEYYCSAYSQYGEALKAGVITKEEYDIGKAGKGNLWNYTGD